TSATCLPARRRTAREPGRSGGNCLCPSCGPAGRSSPRFARSPFVSPPGVKGVWCRRGDAPQTLWAAEPDRKRQPEVAGTPPGAIGERLSTGGHVLTKAAKGANFGCDPLGEVAK